MSEKPDVLGRIRRFLTRRGPEPLDATRADLVVVVESFDDAEACSTALDRGAHGTPRWTESDDAVLRHHLELPAEAVEEALVLAGQDGYTAAAPAGPVSSLRSSRDGGTRLSLVLQRVQISTRCTALRRSRGWPRSRNVSGATPSGGTRSNPSDAARSRLTVPD